MNQAIPAGSGKLLLKIKENRERGCFTISNCHSGLPNIFLDTARHEYPLSQPLKWAGIKTEASHILKQFQEVPESNSPSGTHFMAQVSADFLARAKQKDHDRLINMILFAWLFLSNLNGFKGIYALISEGEDRSRSLTPRIPSVWKELQEESTPSKASGPSKDKEQEGWYGKPSEGSPTEIPHFSEGAGVDRAENGPARHHQHGAISPKKWRLTAM